MIMNHSEYIKKLENKGLLNEWKIKSTYIKSRIPITIEHRCGNYSKDISPSNFLMNGCTCPLCLEEEKHNNFVKKVKEQVGNSHKVLGRYTKNDKNILMYHEGCKEEYSITPVNFYKRGVPERCPKCAGNERRSTEQFKEEVKKIYGNKFIVKGNYVNSKTDISIYHTECGRTFNIKPYHFKEGNGCTLCNMEDKKSICEKRIEDILISEGINYKFEGTIRGLQSTRRLNQKFTFDFIIPEYNLVIEYDGKQHFKPRQGNIKKFKACRRADLDKNEQMFKKKVIYVRIPYTISNKNLDSFINHLIENKGILNNDDKFLKELNIYYMNNINKINVNTKSYFNI